MSYDLVFWKEATKSDLSAAKIFEELAEGRQVSHLAELPVDRIVGRLAKEFPGIVTDGGLTYWEGDERGMFEVDCSPQHVHICCRDLTDEDMNRIIDVAREFDCPLYDPQVDRRFDGKSA